MRLKEFSVDSLQAKRAYYIQSVEKKKKIFQWKMLYLEKFFFRIESEINSFLHRKKLKGFITNRLVLQEMLMEFLQAEQRMPISSKK